MDPQDEITVGEVARLTHVSVRTLHHYDEIGLLTPGGRTPAGYRLYGAPDLERLRQILVYRELDFGLDEIALLLTGSEATAADHLRRQHKLLRDRMERGRALLAALEKEMEARQMGISLTPEEQFEIFGTDQVGGEWADEARERWGDSDSYRESARRTATYSKQDWARLKDQSEDLLRRMGAAMRTGTSPDSDAGRALAEEHRQYLGEWFYDCSHAMHRNLAQMYVADDRFRQTFEHVAPGLAEWAHDAITANSDAAG